VTGRNLSEGPAHVLGVRQRELALIRTIWEKELGP
jgi:hypothetical protein